MTRPLKVLQVIDTFSMGGAETWLIEVLRRVARRGDVQMDFLLTSGNEGIFDAEALRLGARMHYLRFGRGNLPGFIQGFRRLLRREQYDAIHDHQDRASGWHYLMGAGVLPPVRVTHVHNPSYQIRNTYGVTFTRRLSSRLGHLLVSAFATQVTGTSNQLLDEYGFREKQGRPPARALYCGFEPARFLGDRQAVRATVLEELNLPQDAKVVLFAGRMDQSAEIGHAQNHKNSGFALSVALKAAETEDRLHLLFAGKASSAQDSLRRQAEAAGCGERVHFLGIRTDIERLMLASDVLLFPSRGEGLGMVAVEAQAAGLPVLASTAVPAECVVVPELVRFRSLDDSQNIWAQDLLDLIHLPKAVAGSNARVAASPFSIDQSASALLQLYSGGRLS